MLAPFEVAALVLCVAGIAKLRAPATTANALSSLGLPSGTGAIRVLGACELVLGAVAAVHPTTATAAAVAVVYLGFSVVAVLLARRGAACGCFGETRAPASLAQAAVSAVLAIVAAGAAISQPHGAPWILERSPVIAACLVLGITVAVFATVVVYTEVPSAWNSWSGR